MESSLSPGKRILVIGGMLLVVLLAIMTAILSSRKPTTPSPTTQSGTKNITPANVDKILEYKPPANARYTALGDVNFLPEKVNNISINRENILKQAQAAYPKLGEADLINTINTSLFTYLAMNDLYARNGKPTSASYSKRMIDSFNKLDSEVHNQASEYEKGLLKLNGFFYKVQFANVRPENIAKLKVKETDLRRLARSLADKYLKAAKSFKDKARVVDFINIDQQVSYLNNGEKAQRFTDYRLYQPLIGEPNFYTTIQSLTVGNFSDVITYQQFIPGKTTLQDAGFAVYYLSGKSGTNLPLQVLRDMYISKARVQ